MTFKRSRAVIPTKRKPKVLFINSLGFFYVIGSACLWRGLSSCVPVLGICLSDEVHEHMLLVSLGSGIAAGMDLLQQPGHVRGEGPHGLHALGVECHLALSGSVGDVPVL